MAERSTISQAVQIGVETTPGTAVAASRRLGSIGIELGVQTVINSRRPIGQKYANLQVLGKEWSEASVSGAPVYTELPYLFASIFSNPTITPEGTGAYKWVFESDNFDADAPRTFTVEQGDSSRAHRAAHALLTDLSLTFDRENMELDGTMLAKAIEDGITLTPTSTQLPQVPVRPSELSVYLDTSGATIGTTKQERAISGEIGIASRFAPVWVLDAAQPSFVATIESEPEVTFNLTQQADAQGMENLERMRAGETVFLQLRGVGPVIEGTTRHEMLVEIAGQVAEPNPFGDEDGIYGIEWGFGAVFDPTWGHAVRAEVITTTATL